MWGPLKEAARLTGSQVPWWVVDVLDLHSERGVGRNARDSGAPGLNHDLMGDAALKVQCAV